MAVGFLFVIMWLHYLIVYHFDATTSTEHRGRLQFKAFVVWIWNVFDFCARSYLMKTSATDITAHHLMMIVILPFTWYQGLILKESIFCTLFHESIVIYFAAYRLHQFYEKAVPLAMHWVGSMITFTRLCVTFHAAYHHLTDCQIYQDFEWILASTLILGNLIFDILWIQLVIKRALIHQFTNKRPRLKKE